MRFSLNDIAEIMSRTLPKETLATIVGIWVGSDADERLADDQADLAALLFEAICQVRPDVVELAMNTQEPKHVIDQERGNESRQDADDGTSGQD